ncbi:MAG: STAS domain-containing protein [Syntrophomonas sp.]
MDLPILQVGKILVVSMQTDMDDELVLRLQDKLLRKIQVSGSLGVVFDLSGVEIMDSFMCRILNEISQMAYLMGARVVVTGIQAPVAITMIELGIDPQDIPTMLTLDKGLAYLTGLTNSG